MENILYFLNKNNYKNFYCKTEDEIVAYGEGEDLVAIKPNFESYLIATYDIISTTGNTQLLGASFTLSQIIEMYVDDVKLDNVVNTYKFNTIGKHTVKMYAKCMTSCSSMFNSCYSLTSLDLSHFDTSNVTSMGEMFYYCNYLTSLDLSNFDTSNVTNMSGMFSICNNLTSLDLSSFDTSKVTNMYSMFYKCSGLTSLDLSSFDTSNVTNMESMLYGCSGLTSLDLTSWDVSNVSNYGSIFYNTNLLHYIFYNGEYKSTYNKIINNNNKININISSPITIRCNVWDRLYNDNIYTMVLDNGCRAEYDSENNQYIFTFIPEKNKLYYDVYVDGIKSDSIKVTNEFDIILINAQSIIYEEVSATSTSTSYKLIAESYKDYIDAMFIDGEQVSVSYTKTFNNINNTRNVKIAFSDTSSFTNMEYMFTQCNGVYSLKFSETFNTANITSMYKMFYNCDTLTFVNLSSFDTSKVTDMSYMFGSSSYVGSGIPYSRYPSPNLAHITFGDKWDTSNVTNMSSMFSTCNRLITLDLSNFDTSNVTNMCDMFCECYNLISITFGDKWDTSNVTNMGGMFNGCKSIKFIDLTLFDTSNVTNMSSMFCLCSNLKATSRIINFDKINVSNVNNIELLFKESGLNYVTFGNNFNDIKVKSFYYMFYGCSSLYTVDVSNLNTSNVNGMAWMFNACNSLSSITFGDNFDTSKVTGMYNMFRNCYNLTSLDLSSFDTSKVTDMNNMFCGCSRLTSLDLSNFDTSNVRDMSNMFYGCSSLTSITILSNVVNVVSYSYMFYNLPSNGTLTYPCAYSDTWDNLLVTNSGSTYFPSTWTKQCQEINITSKFKLIENSVEIISGDVKVNNNVCIYNATEKYWVVTHNANNNIYDVLLNDVVVGTINLSKKINYVFIGDNNDNYYNIIETISVSNTGVNYYVFNSSYIDYVETISVDGTPYNSTSFYFKTTGDNTVKIKLNDNFINLTNLNQMFYIISDLKSISFNGFNASNVTNMSSMFRQCSKLTSIDFGDNFDTSNVTDMNSMFTDCPKLTSITFGDKFDTSNVTNMSYMFSDCSKLTSLDLSSFNTSNVTNMKYMFNYCSGLTSIDLSNFDTSKVTIMNSMFNNCRNLTSLNLSSFDISNVTNMDYMFYYCSKLSSITMLSNPNKVTSYYYMFRYLPSNGTIIYPCVYSDSWNKLLVTYRSSTYFPTTWTKQCQEVTVTNKFKLIENGIELSEGDFIVNGSQCTFNENEQVWIVTYNTNQINNDVLLNDVVVGNINGSKDLNYVFIGNNNSSYSGFNVTETVSASSTSTSYRLIYSSFTQYIDAMLIDGQQTTISSAKTFSSVGEHTVQMIMDTSNCTSMYNMFSGCTNLTSIEFGNNFDTSNVIYMSQMFYGCNKLTSLDLTHFNTSAVTNMSHMFCNCSGLTSLDLTNFDTSKVTDMTYMFCNCSGLTSLDLTNFDTSKVTNMSYMFDDCRKLTSLDLSKFDTSKVTDIYQMFSNCDGLTSLDLSSFDTSKVTSINGMFQNCSGLTSLNVSSFDTSNVTDMRDMFQNCSDLSSLNVSSFDTSKVTSMTNMFGSCKNLTSLDLSSFNTSNVTNMSTMFSNCYNLTSLDLSNFDTFNVTNMEYMFNCCSGLTSLDLSNFNTFNVTNMAYMFSQCNSLTSLTMTSDVPKLNNTNYMFSGITTNGIFTYPCMYDYELITNKLPTSWTENCVSVANVTLNFVIIDNNIEVTEGTVIVNDIEATYSNENGYWSVTYTIDEPYSDVILNGTNIGIITNSKYNNLQHILIGDCSNYVDISATYTATSANQTISLFSGSTTTSAFNLSNIEAIYVDGKMITPRSSYTFTTVGEHDVKYFVKDSITTMSFYYAFYNIDYLKTIKFGNRFNNENSVSTLQYAFYDCDRLNNADLSNISMSANTSSEQLQYCFQSCDVLTSVTLPQNIDDIGDYCFSYCSGLTSINIPSSVKYIGYSAFSYCYKLSEIRIPSSVTSADSACFAYCSGATSLVFEEGCQLKTIPSSGFMNCDSLTTVTIPEGISGISTSAFYSCNNIKTITLPSTLTSIGNSGFSYCNSALTEIYSYAKTAPSISNYTFYNVKNNGTLHIPTNADYSSWLSTSSYYLGYYTWNSAYLYTPTACTELTITALDVKGRATSTTISYTAVTNGVDSEGTEVTNVTMTGTTESTPFEQNTDTANTVTRTITFEYMGVTASTEITQGVWTNETYSINLNNQWQLSTTISNPDSSVYDGVYESYAHKGVNSSADICIITIEGYTNFTLYVRSYAESTWDYVVVSNLDCTLNSETTGGTNVKMTTSGNQQSNTAITAYTKVEFTNIDGGEHTIQVMYRKDSSQNHNDDRGYLLIPKEQ